MKKDNWWIIGIAAVVILLASFGGGMTLAPGASAGVSGGWGYHGAGMMGNWGYSPLGWFGMGLGMLFMWIIPIGVLTLIVFGIASLARGNGSSSMPSSSQTPCPNCTKGVQTDWSNCPYCGTALK